MKELGYEIWVVRSYFPDSLNHASIGLVFFPHEIMSIADDRKASHKELDSVQSHNLSVMLERTVEVMLDTFK